MVTFHILYLLLLDIEGATNTIDAIGAQENIVNKIVEKEDIMYYQLKVSRIYNDETITAENYYIVDYQITIDKLISAIRDHWNIECGLH